MKTFLYIAASTLVVGFAFWAYQVNYATQAAVRDLDDLRLEIAQEREVIGMLRAEWAYLNRPDRLRLLAETYYSDLQLAPMTATHFADPAEVPFQGQNAGSALADKVLGAVLEGSE
ncbi:MAG: cell division protein FtsL [Pseudomonadota bacterium]